MSEPTAQPFDCIRMKRDVQARIYEETKDLTGEELLEYFRRKAEEGPFAEYFRGDRPAAPHR